MTFHVVPRIYPNVTTLRQITAIKITEKWTLSKPFLLFGRPPRTFRLSDTFSYVAVYGKAFKSIIFDILFFCHFRRRGRDFKYFNPKIRLSVKCECVQRV